MLYFLQTTIPEHTELEKGLISIYGIGNHRAKLSLKIYGIAPDARGKDLRRLHRLQLKANFDDFPHPLVDDLKEISRTNIQRLINIYCNRGRRHTFGYPIRGQRTRTNAKNQKRLHKRWKINEFEKPKLVSNSRKFDNKSKKKLSISKKKKK